MRKCDGCWDVVSAPVEQEANLPQASRVASQEPSTPPQKRDDEGKALETPVLSAEEGFIMAGGGLKTIHPCEWTVILPLRVWTRRTPLMFVPSRNLPRARKGCKRVRRNLLDVAFDWTLLVVRA